MSNRYSALNRRPGASGTSSLFADYPGSGSGSRPSSSASQSRPSYAYSDANRPSSPYSSHSQTNAHGYNSSAPYSQTFSSSAPNLNNGNSGYSTPNENASTYKPPTSSYTSTAVLDHLESQNENDQTSLLSSKVSQLKQLSLAIGEEIRESSSLAQTINDQFEGASVKLKRTMGRMLWMAERTGVGWRVWLLFFAVVWCLFVYVWLF